MRGDINGVLFYLAGKNYFNDLRTISKDFGDTLDVAAAIAQIEALDLVHVKLNSTNGKQYLLKQEIKDALHNLPPDKAQDPYSYFKQTVAAEQRTVSGNVAEETPTLPARTTPVTRNAAIWVIGILLFVLALLLLLKGNQL